MNIINNILFILIYCIPKFVILLVAKKYIAGKKISDVLRVVEKLNAKGVMATIDILGENVKTTSSAENAADLYKELLKEINKKKLNATISLKPTHLGLKLNREFCFKNICLLVKTALKYNNFVCIDMEDHTCTSDTIEIYKRLRGKYSNVRIALQSRLRRTLDDVNKLIRCKANIRLCKGVYLEPPELAFQDNEIINNNYIYCLEKLLMNKCYTCIATHDEKLIWHALSFIDRLKLKKDEYEFQVLLGVNEPLWDIILKAGYPLRVYVPFGEMWYEYSMRRFKENPNLMKYIIKQLF